MTGNSPQSFVAIARHMVPVVNPPRKWSKPSFRIPLIGLLKALQMLPKPVVLLKPSS